MDLCVYMEQVRFISYISYRAIMEWEIFNSVNCHLCPASRIEEKNEKKKKEKKNEIIGLSKNDRRSAFKPEKVLREQESLAVWTAGGSKLDV